MDDLSDSMRCSNCNISRSEKRLHTCSRCKAAHYCSRECQKADWKIHKPYCDNNAASTQAYLEHSNTPEGWLDRLALPDGISIYELDKRLEKWVRFHANNLTFATLHALRLSCDVGRARTHVLCVHLVPRVDHGGSAGKYFRVVDAEVVSFADGRKRPDPWAVSLDSVQRIQEESRARGRGHVAATMIACPPLGVQISPFGSIPDKPGLDFTENWQDILIHDVERAVKIRRYDGYKAFEVPCHCQPPCNQKHLRARIPST